MVSNNLSSLISQLKCETENNNDYFVSGNFKVVEIMKLIDNNAINCLIFDWYIYSNENINKINELLSKIVSNGKSIKIIFRFNKVIDFDLLGIEEYVNSNIDFIFSFEMQGYTYEEFLDLQNKINSFIEDIKPNLSCYEKYMIIYNRVRNFKPYAVVYNDNSDLSTIINNKQQSCNFKYIFDNDYIDCLGYCLLLETLLNKVGIEASTFRFDVYDKNGILLGGHARVLINLLDEKYNMNGLFVSDPTWDKEDNNIRWSLLPLSSMRESIYGDCNEIILFDLKKDDVLEKKLLKLKSLHNESMKDTIIELINKIYRIECEKLLKLNVGEFMKELERYLLKGVKNKI